MDAEQTPPPAVGASPTGTPPPSSASGAGSPPPAGGTPPAAGGTASWRETLAPEFKDHAALKDYPDVNALAKSHVHLQSKLGANPIVMPKEDAKPEEWENFYKAVGRPDKPDGYKLAEVKMPDGLPENKEFQNQFKGVFHQAGLTQKQVEIISKAYGEYGAKQFQDMNTATAATKAEGIKKLQTEWGDKYDANVEEARAVVKNYGSQELLDWLDDTGHGDDQAFLRAFHKMAIKVREDRATGEGGNNLAPGEAQGQAEVKTLIDDKEFQTALNKADHPKHGEAVQRWSAAHQKMVGKGNRLVKGL